jgi:hypothetical protein
MNIYHTTWHHIQEDLNLHQQFCENLRFNNISLYTGNTERVNTISWEKKMETPQYQQRVYSYYQKEIAILQYI